MNYYYVCTNCVTSLHTQLKLWMELPAEKQAEMVKHEENAVFNQVVLFVSRVIWLRCPLEFSEGTYNA